MRTTLACLSVLLVSNTSYADKIKDQLQKESDYNYATSIVLSDSDVFTFGFSNFDPNEYLDLEDTSLGDPGSVDLKKKMSVTSLPFTLPLRRYGYSPYQSKLNGRVYLLSNEQDFYISNSATSDKLRELNLGGYLELEQEISLTRTLTVHNAIGTHLMYYKNDYQYRNDFLQDYRSQIDGVYLNTSSIATVGELSTTLKYTHNGRLGQWYIWSSPHYFNGVSMNLDNHDQQGNPEGWYWVNGIKVFYHIGNFGRSIQSFYTSFSRVDLGGDTEQPMNTDHYYETSFGWLMSPPFKIPFVMNIGIGMSLNYGSAFKGGSFVLFFNQA
ncbi:hypothetical protein EGH82_02335 [Vibrio ponticus]|uniref:Solitary outer membrane autotransporter-like beta-barrel domain-containing protein n=1 Tax=Vibrio ponticus TaxID=265668 RepID=A0A3N3E5F7_9VIBR|nr:Solitary outer membrane autotransporter beta-barrel domain [Vibrio ponticus]ROV61937.1 hypothetical protein EGH82_02335 [Vibrio ponticus]